MLHKSPDAEAERREYFTSLTAASIGHALRRQRQGTRINKQYRNRRHNTNYLMLCTRTTDNNVSGGGHPHLWIRLSKKGCPLALQKLAGNPPKIQTFFGRGSCFMYLLDDVKAQYYTKIVRKQNHFATKYTRAVACALVFLCKSGKFNPLAKYT